jgi:hypothetical protein
MGAVKAVASAMEMASTVAAASVAPTMATASVAAAPGERRVRQHGRQSNNGNSGNQS